MSEPLVRLVPPPQSLVTGDNAVGFGRVVTHYLVRNRSPQTIYVAVDEAATPSSTAVPAGGHLAADAVASVLHLYLTAEATVNDTAPDALEVLGWDALAQRAFYADHGPPGAGLGLAGDHYLDLDAGTVYELGGPS